MKYLPFILIFFFCGQAHSQNTFSIQGKVRTDSSSEVVVADVLLYQNDTIIKFASLSEGNFSFESIQQGEYLLKILSVGFETYEQKVNLVKSLDLDVVLKESSEKLDEIQIKATKKILENKGGNITANVEGTVLSKETNPIELLGKLPNIQVSPNGESISILGRGTPLIYIGGQRISAEELLSLSVDDIKSIEIINNPSVKYEAEGRAVLLITRKRSSQYGTRLTMTERAYQRTFFNNSLGTNLTVKRNKLEYKFNATYNELNVWEKNTATYEVTDRNILSDYAVEAVTDRLQFILGGGVFYSINDTDYISANTIYRTQEEPFTIDTNTLFNTNGNQQTINTDSENEGIRRFSSSNVNYFNSISKTQNLFLGAQYTNYTRNADNSIQNTFNNVPASNRVEISQDFNIQSLVLKGDYDVTTKKDSKWEMGFNYAGNLSKSVQDINGDRNNYEYRESIAGIYTQFSGKKKKMDYNFGVRLENTKVEGGFVESSSLLVDRNNTFLFPRANVNFAFSEKRSLNLSYVRSISRPNYSTAIVNTAFINPELEFRGNINLKPTLTSEVSASYQFKNKSITLRYFRNTDPVTFRFFYDESNDISVMSPTNFDVEKGIDLTLYLPFKHKFWTSTNSLNFTSIRLEDSRASTGKTQPYIYYYSNQQFKLSDKSSINLNGWAITNFKNGIFHRRGTFTINTTFTTKLFEKLDLTLAANDIFNSLEFQDRYTLQNLRVQSLFFTDVNEFSISLRYSLGKIKNSKYQNKRVDDELNRIN